MNRTSQISTRELIRYTEGETTRSEADEIEEILSTSPQVRSRLNEIGTLVTHLEYEDEIPDSSEFYAGVQDRIDRSALFEPKPKTRLKMPAAAAALAAGVALILGSYFILLRPPASDEFQAKNVGGAETTREQWIGLKAYRLRTESRPNPLGASMRGTDGLLFSYTNLGSAPFNYLMIFAIDEQADLYWYYPAYLEQGTNPKSIPIRREVVNFELKDKVVHSMRPGRLSIYGLFSDEALQVLDIEHQVNAHVKSGEWKPHQPLLLRNKNIGQKIIQTRILP